MKQEIIDYLNEEAYDIGVQDVDYAMGIISYYDDNFTGITDFDSLSSYMTG